MICPTFWILQVIDREVSFTNDWGSYLVLGTISSSFLVLKETYLKKESRKISR